MLNRHTGSEDVSSEACWAIRNIGNRDRLIRANAGDTIISRLATGSTNEVLIGETCRALLSMIHDENDPLILTFANAQCAKAVMMALDFRPDSEYVARWCFNLLCYLCSDANVRKQVMSRNILEQLARALQQHSGNEGVAEWCCKTVHLLAQNVEGATVLMKAVGLCETVVGAL